MATEYRIVLHTRKQDGFETFGEFFIGTDRGDAIRLFKKMQGSEIIPENAVFYFEMRELHRGLTFDCEIISCTIEELAQN